MKSIAFVLSIFLAFTSLASAASLPAADAAKLKTAGIPVYSGAAFAIGNKDTGYRYATSDSPEAVRQWYRKQLPSWSIFDQFGSWLLYKGKPGLDMGEVMSNDQVMIQKNDNLPGWHNLKKSMTTEIVIKLAD